MDDQTQVPAAPAQPEAPPASVTAVDQAVASGDQAAFKAARRAEREGKPLEPTTTPEAKTDPPVTPPDRQLSKRQQAINDYERRIAEQEQRIRALEAQTQLAAKPTAPRSEAPPTKAPAAPLPETLKSYDAYLKAHPDATYEDFTDARAEFRVEQRLQSRDQALTQARQRESLTQQQEQRAQQYASRIQEHLKGDPDFLDSLSDDVKQLRPFAGLLPGEKPTARNAIAEEVLSSPVAPQLLRHLSDHPEELARLSALRPRDLLREMAKLEARVDVPAAPAQKPLTTMPRNVTLGTKAVDTADPIESAVSSHDMSAFKAARLRERAASVR